MDQFRLAKWMVTSLRDAGWAPLLVIGVHWLSVEFSFYRRFPDLDVAMHFCGGIAIAWFLHRSSIHASGIGILGPFHPVTHCLLVASMTCVAALVWETAEFLLDLKFGTHYQPGLRDTMVDLLVGFTGGITLLVAVGFWGGISSER